MEIRVDAPDEIVTKMSQIPDALHNWFIGSGSRDVDFIENTNPNPDPNSRFVVTYEAAFEPKALDRMRIEIWVTSLGEIAIGLETKGRIAARLGIKGPNQKVFSAGHEPHIATVDGLVALLTAVSSGKICISAFALPILGLVSTKAVLLHSTDEYLASKGYMHRSWLNVVENFESDVFSHVLQFAPW